MKINSKEIKQVSYNVARKRKKEITNNKEKGITLIALVVTIVVLLILAGVTITMVLGEDGIIAQAKLAAERTREEEAKAEQDFNKLAGDIQNWVNGGSGGTDSGGETPTTDPSLTPEAPTPLTLDEAKQKETTFETTTEVKVGDGTMTVPGGFRVKEGNSIAEGIVITDSAGDTGNEFVWVPVAINDMVWCKDHAGSKITFDKKTNTFTCTHNGSQTHEPINTQLAGKLYATSTGNSFGTPNTTFETSDLREPDVVTDYDTDKISLVDLQKDFYAMAKSVAKYGGFYVGRYETSLSASNKSESKAGAKSLYNDNSNHDWYGQYKYNKAYAEGNEDLAVVSSTIWGCQYDAMMNWMLSNGIIVTSAEPKEITNEDIQRNTDATGRITGASNSKDKLCNIYDLLGNSYEWTMEAYDTFIRVYRGGYYGNSFSPSRRFNDLCPSDTNGIFSARLSLYVNL